MYTAWLNCKRVPGERLTYYQPITGRSWKQLRANVETAWATGGYWKIHRIDRSREMQVLNIRTLRKFPERWASQVPTGR